MTQNALRRLRLEAGYSQARVAGLMGVDRSTYNMYETGEVDIPYQHLSLISNLFGVEIGEICGQADIVLQDESIFSDDETALGESERDTGTAPLQLTDAEERRFAKMRLIDSFGKGDALDAMLDEMLYEGFLNKTEHE